MESAQIGTRLLRSAVGEGEEQGRKAKGEAFRPVLRRLL